VRRTIVIGDLQGCHKEAVKLLELCEARPEDHVIFTGDLLDRGPDNDLCVELAMHRERIQGAPACVMGNHEEKHLHYRALEAAGKDPNVVIPSHVATRQQLRDEHYEYIAGLPLYLRLPEHNAVVVHAGLYPGRTVEQQEARHLMHVQMINPYDKWGNPTGEMKTMWPSKAPDHWKFWTNFYNGPERVIFGHSVFDKPLVTDKLYGIDGGACFGLKLHALILPEWRIVSVDGEADHGSRSRGRDGKRITKYLVHGDVATFS
jgi:hypothetical protein